MSVVRFEEVGYDDEETEYDFKLMEPPPFERVHFGGEDGIRVQSGVCRFSSTSHHARVKSLATAVQPHLPEMRDDFAVRCIPEPVVDRFGTVETFGHGRGPFVITGGKISGA